MKFTLRNLGRLEEATIDLDKDLIVLTGPNNTSKTYVAHAIYGFCKHHEGDSSNQETSRRFGPPFILTADRGAIQVFGRAIDARALDAPDAIRDNVTFANNVRAYRDQLSAFAAEADHLERMLLRGAIRMKEDGEVVFLPDAAPDRSLPLAYAPSSVRTLAGLALFLRHIAQEGSFLIMEEPELNLHPDSQRRIARVISRLAHAGIKVLISTHSDYIIRELNCMLMLSSDSEGVLRRRHGYDEHEVLRPTQVCAYQFDTGRAESIEVKVTGIEVESIDREIDAINTISQDIYFSLRSNTAA